ncbi:hypothetical protein [Microbacterium imperiale]|uniref:Uncharacterized protein n=1 Tax=Microbacterium imperiale TaxID=33884 RepID=A0A9W6M2C4_9MICO|nr:hypothetical protein [Microbacterium imperiale]MBP2420024.1 hypothetical protein [Microbacterium imperiale]MDS0198113.1 hypothetical protein [Microbacterium imperiale]BFE40365.1 hypothetical protein GCM10017544_13210 [Microbacterium imperiale]GLJ78659.1 hypothetical protein GCM10017586_03410 [Microbacterium imperiale]
MSAEHAPIAPVAPISPRQAGKSNEIIKRLIGRRITLKADAEYIAGELESIDAQLIELLGTVGSHDVDGTKVEVREYSRTDYGALEKAYPVEQYPALYVTKQSLDQAAVKKQFAPAALEAFKVAGKKSVVVK